MHYIFFDYPLSNCYIPDAFIKQQLSSLIFLSSQCEERMEMLRDGIVDHIDLPVVCGNDSGGREEFCEFPHIVRDFHQCKSAFSGLGRRQACGARTEALRAAV